MSDEKVVIIVPIPEGNNSRYVQALREQTAKEKAKDFQPGQEATIKETQNHA